MNSHPHSPQPCKSCHWALEGLKRPPDPTPEQIRELDAFLGGSLHRDLIDDSRGKLARAWMDKIHPHLRAFWQEDYQEQLSVFLPHNTERQLEYFLALMLEFYPSGPRYTP
jgi:hypothetical protein